MVAALALAGGAGARPGSESRASAGHSRLQVTQVEFRLMLSRGVVKAGSIGLEAVDRGMDPHDLRLRPVTSRQEIAVPELKPGQRWDLLVHLKPGIYQLWCSLPEHAKLGMRATLRVVR
jgi:uncharacterized cupredoxin-like copper-binding protein